jgi:hypothetical protein
MYEPIAVNSRYRRSVRLDFILYSHRTSSSKFLSYTSPAIEPCPHGSVPTDHGRTTVDDGRPRSRLLRRLYCTTLMSSTVDNVCIHVHRHLDPRRRRPRRGQPLRPICTPVTTTRHTGTRDAEPRASSFLTSFHAPPCAPPTRATTRKLTSTTFSSGRPHTAQLSQVCRFRGARRP